MQSGAMSTERIVRGSVGDARTAQRQRCSANRARAVRHVTRRRRGPCRPGLRTRSRVGPSATSRRCSAASSAPAMRSNAFGYSVDSTTPSVDFEPQRRRIAAPAPFGSERIECARGPAAAAPECEPAPRGCRQCSTSPLSTRQPPVPEDRDRRAGQRGPHASCGR